MKTTSDIPGLAGAKDTAVVFSMTVLALVCSIGVQSCLAWVLLPAGRGQYAVCIAFASIMAAVFTFGTERAIQYYLISKRLSLPECLGLVFTIMLCASAVAAGVGWFLVDAPIPYFSKADRASFHIALAIVPTLALITTLAFLLEAERRFFFSGIARLISIAVTLVLTLVLVAGMKLGVNGALLSLFIGGVAAVFVQTLVLGKDCPGRVALPTLAMCRDVLSYGLRYHLARLGNIIEGQLGVIILALFATKAEIGLFAAATALMNRVLLLPDSLNRAIQPRLGAVADGRPELVAQSARLLLAITGICIGALAILSHLFIPILLSPAFRGCITLIWIVAPGIWFRGFTKPFVAYFIAVNRPGIASLATGVRLTAGAFLMLALYPFFALPGAAWALTVANIAAAAVLVLGFRVVSQRSFGGTWSPRYADMEHLFSLARGALRRSKAAARADNA